MGNQTPTSENMNGTTDPFHKPQGSSHGTTRDTNPPENFSEHSSSWGQLALEHVTNLTLGSAGRGSATAAEAKAAEYARQQVERLKVKEILIQPFNGLRSIWLFMSLVFGLALVGHAAYWLLRPAIGDVPSLLILLAAFGLAGYILWRKYTFRNYPLRGLLPHGPSQNVLAVIPPQGERRKRVVLIGHLDSHRAVFWWANDLLFKVFTISSPIAIWGVYASGLLYALTILTDFQPLAWAAIYLALNHFLGWFTGVTADLGAYSPGANDNASAVGTLLALAERLQNQPLDHTEVTLAFTGCEETGCDGMVTFVQELGQTYRDALFLDFEVVGAGDQIVYLSQEGTLRKKRIPPEVKELVEETGKGFNLVAYPDLPSGTFTETGVIWEHGFRGVTLAAKFTGKSSLPEWHRLSDVPSKIQAETLEQVHQLAWQILQRVDSG